MAITQDDLRILLERPIAYHHIFGRIAGGATNGLFLSQAFFWTGKGTLPDGQFDPEGWFYKTMIQWEEETCLTRREQQTARKALKDSGVLEEKHAGLPAKLYFRVNMPRLLALVNAELAKETTNKDARNVQPGATVSRNQGRRKAPPKDERNVQPRMRVLASQERAEAPALVERNGQALNKEPETTPEITPESTPETRSLADLFGLVGGTPSAQFRDRTGQLRRYPARERKAVIEEFTHLAKRGLLDIRDESHLFAKIESELHTRRQARA